MDGLYSGATVANPGVAAVNGNSVPPFLSKTYDMVDDPSTNSVVSWSDNNNSFIVWSVPELARDILPKYFKHNNFSSFVRQLNTYGFRKVDPDRWEFANEGFLRGQKQLLKNINRRKAHVTGNQQVPPVQNSPVGACVEVGKFGLEEEVERLKRDKNVLMQELVRLRQQQQTTDNQLQSVGQRVQVMEQRQQQMMSFLAKAMQSPSFLAQFVQQQNESNRHINGGNKKRRLAQQDEDNLATEHVHNALDGRVVKYQPSMNEAAKALLRQILQINTSARMESAMKNADAFLIDDVPSAIALDSRSSSSRISGVTLAEVPVPPTSGQSYTAVESEFPVNCMLNGISKMQSSSAVLTDCIKAAEFPELDLHNSQDAVLDFGKVQGVETESSLVEPDLNFLGPDTGDIADLDMMSAVLDGTSSVEADAYSPNPDVIAKLPGINDAFWEQFLTASSLTGDTDETDSSSPVDGLTKDQEFASEMENGQEKMDKRHHIDHLTQQMGLLASESS
ncbi:hypothetical protein L6164_035341 [Bauhinia variegata]|uniref:Uncharacterized protein n=1 Tax=Bauhinia variegata TaxID=167791 RepID=A0ACB9KDP3_BAUVA|nr:hypothetical protein L6164_035341 [Bauhinia variegata]